MEKILSFDAQGRIYIPYKLRKYMQFKSVVARLQGKGIYIEPIEEDPLEALSKLGKGKMKDKSIEQLKKEAREDIEKNAN